MDILANVEPVLPAVAVAEEIPEVLMIQVEMDGTVVIAIAPTRKLIITSPKDMMPFWASLANFGRTSSPPEVSNKTLYFSIYCKKAYS